MGIFGLDVKQRRGYDTEFKGSIHEAYRESVQDWTPVWKSVNHETPRITVPGPPAFGAFRSVVSAPLGIDIYMCLASERPYMSDFSDRIALITGSSRGIGAATAERLAERGARVVVNYRSSEDEAESVAAGIRDAGGEALVQRADVTDPDAVESMVTAVEEEWGTIDVLVNNANMPFEYASFAEMDWADFESKLDAELKAAFTVSKAVLPGMAEQGYGRAVYVSSGLGRRPQGGFIAHGTAKGGLDSFVKYLAQEYGADGVAANVVAPGIVETPATEDRIDDVREHVIDSTPLDRVAQPEDVAGAITALASDDARFVTGTYTPVNGGSVME
ncbi:SDR family NAD(P)-dependent oxidoreductase [Halarchaeum acidiphilum]|uniref:SDR family NAD(P)-dependent oxidoreductase n=1 Tax=Halarchaeum acidiphilum TaxID=489138 RepID=UPI00037FEB39|nr:SDR family oxidoreductase [Halarchaeum acidiphilum]